MFEAETAAVSTCRSLAAAALEFDDRQLDG